MDIDDRPRKKPRFFITEEEAEADATLKAEASAPDELNALPDTLPDAAPAGTNGLDALNNGSSDVGFDSETFQALTGEKLRPESLKELKQRSGGNLERAVNYYFDGSWKDGQLPEDIGQNSPPPTHQQASVPLRQLSDNGNASREKARSATPKRADNATPTRSMRTSMPERRYIGAFGVAAWATRSGTGLIKHGEKIGIERTKKTSQTKIGKFGRPSMVKGQDIIVRITNTRGEEVGRLENESANWISALLDQRICTLEASCVFAPEKIRTNDTIYLQLRCYLLRVAFEAGNFLKPLDNNRQTGLFEAKETFEERALRMRQVAMVRLFDEINLHPSKVNATTAKHKRQGLLRAAEIAEQYEEKGAEGASKLPKSKKQENGGSSPPSEDAEVEDGKELEQDQLDSLYKKAQSFDFNTPEVEPAPTFAMDLRKYQRQALHWMMGKEKDEKSDSKEKSMHPLWEEYTWPTKDVDDKELPYTDYQEKFFVNPYSGEMSLDFPVQEQNCLGGILADEMGLGKTIEMLSLIHSHRATLDEPADSTNAGTVNDLPRLPKDSSSVEKAPRTTLVVAPMSLLAQWQSEAEKASQPGTLKVMVYYGSEKTANLQNLCCAANAANAPNVIITSYGVILSEFNQVAAAGGNRGSHGGLFSLEYFRIILDEAHLIKNRQSKTAKACYELAAIHRWVLTGTPIVNRLEDLFSLVRFLRVEPWSNFSFWKTFITVPFESGDFIRALDVVQTVLEPLVMRRTKDMKTPDGEALVPLPPKTVDIEPIELSKAEREVYDYIFTRAKKTFNANVEAGTVMKSYTTIFAQILRLRQSCCHPILTRNKAIVADEEDAAAAAADTAAGLADDMDLQTLIERFTADAEGEQDVTAKYGAHVLKQIQDEAEQECPICAEEPMNEQCVTGCWHSACKQCLLDYIAHQVAKNEVPRCFNCREPINARDVFEVIRHDDRVSLQRVGSSSDSSAKIAALVTALKKIRKDDSEMKSVVFSQFTAFLDLLEPALSRAGIPFLRFDGSMAQKQRAAVLNVFTDVTPNKATRGQVLLLSLRAGGVGLNLTIAKRVFMMDPWWSFAVEAQAIDRVHRMGQDSDVKVTRFIVKESIEEKMLRIQERKKFIASSLGMMSDEEKKKARIEDIKELLS